MGLGKTHMIDFSMSSWLTTSLLVVLLVLVGYIARTVRNIGRKLNVTKKELSQFKKDSQQAFKSNAALQSHIYRQTESYAQLVSLLEFSEPIPLTRSWAVSPDILLTLVESIRIHKPKLIVELGSGLSTLIMAKTLPRGSRIISFDHSAEFAQQTRDLLKRHSIKGVEIRVAPIEDYNSEMSWYSKKSFSDLKKIDMLLIDGPPGSKDPQARAAARIELLAKLSPHAVVIIDDANRDGERALAEAFAQDLPGHTLRFLRHEKGAAIISPA